MVKKRNLLVAFLWVLITVEGFTQLMDVKLVVCTDIPGSFWEITNKKDYIITNKEVQPDDTIYLSLEINTLFHLNISVDNMYNKDSVLFELYLDGNKTLVILKDVGSGDFSFPFFTGAHNRQLKVVGGKNIDISKVPWQVYLEAGNYMCGGSILSENWVVTAAHCTEDDNGNNISAGEMRIKVGATNPYLSTQGKIYSVQEVHRHEKYNSQTIENDIALLKIEGTIDFENAESIDIVTAEEAKAGVTAPGVLTQLTGWGLTAVSPDKFPDNLQTGELPVVSNTTVIPKWGLLPSTMLMAGYSDGRVDACSGDSGGPLTINSIDGWKLAGIVSWGSEDCNTYGAYTRVSSYETWIRDITGIQPRFKPNIPDGPDVVCQGTNVTNYSLDIDQDASQYQWELIPDDAAQLINNLDKATLNWDNDFYGSVTLRARVIIDNKLSLWSVLDIDRAEYTSIISQSGDKAVCANQPVALSVIGNGHNLGYRWYNNENPAQVGILNELKYPTAQVYNSGNIICDVVGSCGAVTSLPMNLTVYPLTEIHSISKDVEVEYNNPIILDVLSSGHNLSYQWFKDKQILMGETNPELYISSSNAGNIGLYTATVSGTCGVEQSDTVYVYSKNDEIQDFSTNVWPGTNNIFNIAINTDKAYDITIYNTLGEQVYKRIDNHFKTSVDMYGFVSGIYLMNVESEGEAKIFKVVVQ